MIQKHDFYKDLLDHLYDGVYFVDLERRITYWNNGAERITGYARERVLGFSCADNLLMHVNHEGLELCKNGCPLTRAMLEGTPCHAAVFLHHANGHRVPVLVRVSPVYDAEGRITGAVEIFSDNSSTLAAIERAEELQKAALLDEVTGVANRRYLEIRLQTLLAESAMHGGPLGILFLDLDYFKVVNDSYGHPVGDKVLRMVAETIAHNVRAFDIAGRWGGDEFVVALLNVSPEGVRGVAEKLRMLIESSRLTVGENQVGVTASIGATLARPDDDVETLIGRADALLYRGKSDGRNRVRVDV